MTTTTKLQELLTERLDVWDEIDQAYDDGNITRAINLTKYVQNTLQPQIRKEYCL